MNRAATVRERYSHLKPDRFLTDAALFLMGTAPKETSQTRSTLAERMTRAGAPFLAVGEGRGTNGSREDQQFPTLRVTGRLCFHGGALRGDAKNGAPTQMAALRLVMAPNDHGTQMTMASNNPGAQRASNLRVAYTGCARDPCGDFASVLVRYVVR